MSFERHKLKVALNYTIWWTVESEQKKRNVTEKESIFLAFKANRYVDL